MYVGGCKFRLGVSFLISTRGCWVLCSGSRCKVAVVANFGVLAPICAFLTGCCFKAYDDLLRCQARH